MKRFKLIIEYDGTGFSGWQRQPNAASIQGTIEAAIQKFSGVTEPCLYVAGRTDAGVHALGQVAHIDLPQHLSAFQVMSALNHYLQNTSIVILSVDEVELDFHARFSATKRTYIYRILNRRPKPSLEKNRVWHIPVSLDVEVMQTAAAYLVGYHDFTSFRATECQSKSALKTIESFFIVQGQDRFDVFVEAPSFLHHQVRNMVGTLVDVGKGRYAPLHIKTILDSKNRASAGPTAPPHGLYLAHVWYESSTQKEREK